MTSLLGRVLELSEARPGRPFANIWKPGGEVSTVTYGELVLAASGFAGALAGAGVRRGDVVVVIVRPGEALLSAWLAPLLLGAIPSIFPWPTEKLSREYYEKSVASLLSICGARTILVNSDLEETLRKLAEDLAIPPVTIDVEGCRPAAAPLPVARDLREDAEAIAVLQHSSGSTGLQKGIALSSRAVFNQIESYGRALAVTDADSVANWMPLYHDGGLVAGFLQPLLRGLRLSILSPLDWVHDPALLFQAITRDRCTLCWLPNFAYNFLARKIPDRQLEGIDLSSMRAFVNTAEPVRASSHEMFLSRFRRLGLAPTSLTTSYGTAENTLAITQSDPSRPLRLEEVDRSKLFRDGVAAEPAAGSASVTLVSCGPPIPNTRVAVLGPRFDPLPERRVGELAIRSDCMLTEYFRRPDLTARAFHDGWYLTGDNGYLSGGEVFVTGRKKDLIIVGGANVYPQDLEAVTDGVEGVHPGRTVAFGVENEGTGTEDVVVLFEAEGSRDSRKVEDDVRRAIARQSDCVARTVAAVPAAWLVKTSSGKISRTRCKEKFLKEKT
ncbi:MAG: AMP-binding protein [Thermoanaerobaculia bacterium]